MQSIRQLKTSDRAELVYVGCITVFIMSLVVTAVTASKLYDITILGLTISVPVGTSLFALTFLATDILSEVWGKTHAKTLVLTGFITRIFVLGFLYFAVTVPGGAFWENQTAYASVLWSSANILLAGIITYPVSQLVDVYVFHWLKGWQGNGNYLWLRNNLSTFLSQIVDSTLFVMIAFYAVLPTSVLLGIIAGQVLVKCFIAIIDTPFVYFFRNYATGRQWNDLTG